MDIWEEMMLQQPEDAEVLRHTCIADIVTTIIILLFIYRVFTSIFMFMEAIIFIRHEFLYF